MIKQWLIQLAGLFAVIAMEVEMRIKGKMRRRRAAKKDKQ